MQFHHLLLIDSQNIFLILLQKKKAINHLSFPIFIIDYPIFTIKRVHLNFKQLFNKDFFLIFSSLLVFLSTELIKK